MAKEEGRERGMTVRSHCLFFVRAFIDVTTAQPTKQPTTVLEKLRRQLAASKERAGAASPLLLYEVYRVVQQDLTTKA